MAAEGLWERGAQSGEAGRVLNPVLMPMVYVSMWGLLWGPFLSQWLLKNKYVGCDSYCLLVTSSQHSVGIQQCEATQRKLLSTACVNSHTLKGMSGTVLTTFMSIPLAYFGSFFCCCLRTSVKWYLQTQREQTWAAKGERRGGMNWRLGMDTFTLLCAKQRMNEDPWGCVALGSLLGALWWPTREGNPKQRGYEYMYGWFPCYTAETNTTL